jgi:hypothetical protein
MKHVSCEGILGFHESQEEILVGPYFDSAGDIIGLHNFGCQFSRSSAFHLYSLLNSLHKQASEICMDFRRHVFVSRSCVG